MRWTRRPASRLSSVGGPLRAVGLAACGAGRRRGLRVRRPPLPDPAVLVRGPTRAREGPHAGGRVHPDVRRSGTAAGWTRSAALIGALVGAGGAAEAGGIDRAELAIGVLFEPGGYVQLSFGGAFPDVSGAYAPLVGGGGTGDMAPDFGTVGVAVKRSLGERVDAALLYGQPYGADARYEEGLYAGLGAEWRSDEVAALLRYRVTPRASVFGGLRAVRSESSIEVPAALLGGASYTGRTDGETEVGAILGAAFEIPDIALRASLTYRSELGFDFVNHERLGGLPEVETRSEVTIPRSLQLDLQSAIDPRTLVFAGVRWSEWSAFAIAPPLYAGAPDGAGGTLGPIVDLREDTVDVSLGAARRLTDTVSLIAGLGFEEATGDANRLVPASGSRSVSLAARYEARGLVATGGVTYQRLGEVAIEDAPGVTQRFEDNDAWGVGLTLGYRF